MNADRTGPFFRNLLEQLIEEDDELFIEVVSDRVESITGYKPDPNAVSLFLRSIRIPTTNATSPKNANLAKTVPTDDSGPGRPMSGRSITFLGKQYPIKNARDALIKSLNLIAERDQEFLNRFVEYPTHGRKRRYIARRREDLFPGNPHLITESHELKPGYWVGLNNSNKQTMVILRLACEIAAVQFGRDLLVDLE